MPWSAQIHAKLHLDRVTQEIPRRASVFGYGSFTLCGTIFHSFHVTSGLPCRAPTTPIASYGFGLFRFRSPLLTESILFLFLRLLRCFTSPGIANSTLCIQWRRTGFNQHRLPHSEICGSKCICHYPQLIAAYHVLHRLLAPRHSPCTLCSLINLLCIADRSQPCTNLITETRYAHPTRSHTTASKWSSTQFQTQL